MADIPIALQLYTVREPLAADYIGTLRKVADLGYDHVQLTAAIPLETQHLKSVLDDLGLGVAGIHVGGNQLREELDKWISFCQVVGTVDLIWPFLPPNMRESKADWLEAAGIMDELGARCKDRGIRLSYHNHSFEFVKFDGTYGLDLLYENTEPDHLYAELDTYWVKHGGEEPVEYIQKYSGRLATLHVKDMADDADRSFAEVGSGILDWPAICDAAVEAGVKYYVVEQDTCPGDPLQSARQSLEFLRGLTA